MPRRDQYLITVSVTDVPHETPWVFDTMTGGEIDSEALTYRPGGLAEAVSLGGTKNIGNVTVGRMMNHGLDLAVAHDLFKAVGRADVTITKTHLDVDKNPSAVRLVYTGKLKTVTFPDVDSESSEAGIITLEIACSGTLAK